MKRTIRITAAVCGGLVVAASVSCVALLQTRAGRQHVQAEPSVWTPPTVLPSVPAAPSGSPSALPLPSSEPLIPPSTISGTARVTTGVISSLAVRQRVVFITIDDGNVRDPRVLSLIRSTHVPITAFLIENSVNVDPAYWQSMAQAGVRIENHTVSHPQMPTLSLASQESQICTPEPRYAGLFGRRPAFFRPPYGSYDDATLRAADHCGIAATFLWDATYRDGYLATWGGRSLRPGDIILMHFLSSTYDDLVRLMRMLRAANLGVGSLEDYVHVPPPKPSPSPTTPPPSPTPSPTHTPSPSPTPSPTTTPSPSETPTPSPTPSPSRTAVG